MTTIIVPGAFTAGTQVIDVHDGRQPAVDDPLEVAGSPREVGLTFPYHVAAPLTLPGTQMIATLPESLMRAPRSPA